MKIDIQKLSNEDLKRDNKLFESVSALIRETFSEIADKYDDQDVFKRQVETIESTLNNIDSHNVFYIIQDSKQKLLWCLWWIEKENFFFGEKFWTWNMFFSKFVGIDKDERRKWIASSLKKFFEEEAKKKAMQNKETSVVISKVNKNNEKSIARNLKNGYE